MRKLAAGAVSVVLIAATSLSAIAPVQAAPHNRDYWVGHYCSSHRATRDCRDWQRNRHHWGDSQYRRFYQNHGSALPAIVGGIFGFALGAAAAGAANNNRGSNWDYHVRACEAHYRSYNPRTDTYLGYDGQHHRCTY